MISLRDCIAATASRSPEATAIVAPGRAPLSYARLLSQISYVEAALKSLRIRRAERVVVVLPDGPEAAVTLLAVASSATCAPLDPRCTPEEFHDHLTRLRATAVILPSGGSAALADVARRTGVAVIDMVPLLGMEAGIFRLCGADSAATGGDVPQDENVALILRTSGTMSQSKLVPLTHRNLQAATSRVGAALGLTPDDRYLNLTSLFYSQGVLLTFSSLAAAGSVVCPPGFSSHGFLEWTREFSPTWYSAAPALHQAILTHARGAAVEAARPRFRFIRSAAAALPPPIREQLEEQFRSPVIEAYGMTECYPISSNPLESGARKPGSAGLAAGTDVAILNAEGESLSTGSIGEIVVRGPHVMPGYLNEPSADAFTRGWFRTGDQGYLDPDGYLFVTGRLKEIINRGGQKISPLEIDQALSAHPGVSEAVAFPIPHATLGEDLAVSIVLRDRASTTEDDIRSFAASRLAPYKVPRRVIFLDKIPKSAGGKVQRAALTRRFGASARTQTDRFDAGPAAASPGVHDVLRAMWADLLGVESVGIRDCFFDLGGNSLLAVELILRIENQLGKELPLPAFLEAPTIESLAEAIYRETQPDSWRELVPVRPQGSDTPFFWVHGDASTWSLASHLNGQQPVYGLEHQSRDGRPAQFTTVETIAAHYLDEVRSAQAAGPYLLGGFSFGGTIAFEMAQQLRHHGERVSLLVMLDPEFPGSGVNSDSVSNTPAIADVGRYVRALHTLAPRHALQDLVVRAKRTVDYHRSRNLKAVKTHLARIYVALGRPIPPWLLSQYLLPLYQNARLLYRPAPYSGNVVYIKSQQRSDRARTAWAGALGDQVAWHEVPGSHVDLITQSYASAWIEIVKSELERLGGAKPVVRNITAAR